MSVKTCYQIRQKSLVNKKTTIEILNGNAKRQANRNIILTSTLTLQFEDMNQTKAFLIKSASTQHWLKVKCSAKIRKMQRSS
ncbi:hypothetical protein FGO68_gene10221 [Halteria grandinella]|uniref:Uncharacterized protein n=1 Tax=Halteria grandinella TaxID=5974 RepID=A0A8J8SX21_HALGN|nr:hypothetical protein FGO68_gene10221 [Halteria grandinella]